MVYYRSCESWHCCMEHIYNGKTFLRLHRGGDGFHSQCILAIFIRLSGVGCCLYSYHDLMRFSMAAIMILRFLSAPARKMRCPQPKEIFLVYKGTHFQNSLFSQDKYIWMGPFYSDYKCNCGVPTGYWRLGRGGISSCWDFFHGMCCDANALAEFLSDDPL